MMTTNSYYISYPRDFANEYTVYVVTPEIAADFAKAFPDLKRTSRKDAIERAWSRPKEAKRTGEQWFGGFCDHMSPQGNGLDHALAAAAKSTEWEVEQRLADMAQRETSLAERLAGYYE
jgi:hypothetical protein